MAATRWTASPSSGEDRSSRSRSRPMRDRTGAPPGISRGCAINSETASWPGASSIRGLGSMDLASASRLLPSHRSGADRRGSCVLGRATPPTLDGVSAILVGRRRALSQLDSALAAAGRIGVVAQIVGEPGIGKSRLALEIAQAARAEGRVVLEGRAQPLGPALPFSIFQDALRLHRRTYPDLSAPPDP